MYLSSSIGGSYDLRYVVFIVYSAVAGRQYFLLGRRLCRPCIFSGGNLYQTIATIAMIAMITLFAMNAVIQEGYSWGDVIMSSCLYQITLTVRLSLVRYCSWLSPPLSARKYHIGT